MDVKCINLSQYCQQMLAGMTYGFLFQKNYIVKYFKWATWFLNIKNYKTKLFNLICECMQAGSEI